MNDKKQIDPDDGYSSAASSDTDSFVHLEAGSTGTNSDSEWEKVGSYHTSSGESDEEEEEEEEDSENYDDADFLDDAFKITPVPNKFMSATSITTTTTIIPTPTIASTDKNNNNNNSNNNNYTNNNKNNNNNNNNINNSSNNYNYNDLSLSKFVNIDAGDDEDVMLAQALQMSLHESNAAIPKNASALKTDTLTARFERLKISPDDSVDAIGVAPNDQVRLSLFGVYTVRQLAGSDPGLIRLLAKTGSQSDKEDQALLEAWELAMRLCVHSTGPEPTPASTPTPPVPAWIPVRAPAPAPVSASAPSSAPAVAQPVQIQDDGTTVWGYHYLAESVYEQIKEDRTIKSAYVLFHEYMECPVQLRSLHAWKRVYHAYLADAAKWNGARGKHKVENLTDTDVYAFLVWRSAESFAKFDVTAGPRAIYFSWTQMPLDTWRDTLEIDKIMGEDLRNPTICDRYARVIRINLSALCSQHRGVMNRVQMKEGVMDSNHWLPTTLTEAAAIQKTNLWADFEPGSSFFSCVPHGNIVMPNGTIPWECIDIMESVNNSNRE